MAFYSVTLKMQLGTQFANNVFTYVTPSPLASMEEAAALNERFRTITVTEIRKIINTNALFVSVAVKANQQPDFFNTHLYPTPLPAGMRTGEPMPLFVAWGFRTPRANGTMRDGRKRFGLISETDQTGGNPTGTMLPILATCAAAISAPLSLSFGGTLTEASHVITKRIKRIGEGGKITYDLPGPGDPLVTYPATAWAFQMITTQNTRKPGRGT